MARYEKVESEFQESVVKVNRVAKVVKGGKRFSFSALVVVGNGRGLVGAGLGKAAEVPDAIKKGTEDAKKNLVEVPLAGTTIPLEINVKLGAARIFMKPASQGTGVIAGGPVRAVVELAGIKDILTKCLGSKNAINIVYATIRGLKEIKAIMESSKTRGKITEETSKA